MKKGLHIDNAGTKRWYLHSKLHRQDGPAVVWADGTEYWYLHGKFHRQDGPAWVCANGSARWFLMSNYLGDDAAGFWTHWALLTNDQRNNLNLHTWLAKYM